jgi:hypothetical protein
MWYFFFTFVVLNHKGRTELICAIDRVEVVKLLLALPGIDYNHKDNSVEKAFINPLFHMPEVCAHEVTNLHHLLHIVYFVC